MGVGRRRLAATIALALAPVVLLVAPGCTDGTTPDCSSPDSGCAPDLTPHTPEASPDETGADARDGGDARRDGPIDAPIDAVDERDGGARDADAATDAPSG